ncbi:LysR substrate-binding domain-containing protein [Bradyrhizobium lablabi]|uniref:LysR substrate-binding domain-containing protein n=1 Tax=Bradyrhizobium lablabi TaxID=722472 RepID=UPI001BA82125|nr:LysR substrate-binding domain-containing protein [Bradyrhizobium lablabi]MBR0695377.1 LysR family transcriptional regulator [Bradyrhizobium lablabi]
MDQLAAMATFVRAVDTGSLSAAARSLSSSLTSVSRQISALEEHFGTRLLLRTTRQLALTDDGRLLYERAKLILGEVKEVEAALSRDRHQPSGRIRVSSPSLMGRLVIAPLLAEFLRRYPALSVELLLVDRPVDMVEEDIHLALRVGRLRDSQLVARRLADLRMIVCASPDYLARRGVPDTPHDLAAHDCLVFSDTPGRAEWRFADDTKAGRKIRITGRLWMNSLDALVGAAKEGAGIVRVPSWQVEGDLATGRLRCLLADYEPSPTPLNLIFQPSRLASPKIRAFVDYLVERWRVINPFGAQSSGSDTDS